MANQVGPMGSYLGRTALSVVYGQESACHVGDLGSIPGLGRSPGEGHDSILAWTIPWTEEPCGL